MLKVQLIFNKVYGYLKADTHAYVQCTHVTPNVQY
jgi:hypothetical protein